MPEASAGAAERTFQETEHRTVGDCDHEPSETEKVDTRRTHTGHDVVCRLEPLRPACVVVERSRERRLELGARTTLPRTGPTFTEPFVDTVDPSEKQTRRIDSTLEIGGDDDVRGDLTERRGTESLFTATGAQRIFAGSLHDPASVPFGFGMTKQDQPRQQWIDDG
jgi:hypothetical protein